MGLKRKKYLDIWTAEKVGAEDLTEFSRIHIDRYTEERLRCTVEYAVKNSPLYNELIGEHLRHITDESTTSREFMKIFESLPFTDQNDLRQRELDMLCVRPNEISRIVTLDTGGSTGVPKRVYFTEEDQQLTVDYFEHGMQMIADESDKVLVLMPAKVIGSIGKLLARGLRNFGAEAIEYGLPGKAPDEAERILELISDEGVTSIVALPTHMKMLVEQLLQSEYGKYADIDVRTVLMSAEYVPPSVVDIVRNIFRCKVYEHYGMTEMGLGCAVGCGFSDGYHIRETDLYIEIIDPDTGEVIRDGRTGEIVFTTLTRKGMPFIRYRTGDYSHWIKEPCECGSILKRIARVEPRTEMKGYLK